MSDFKYLRKQLGIAQTQLRTGSRSAAADAIQRAMDAAESLEEEYCPEEDDTPPICGVCNGSGEGMYDGSRCSSCKGRGTEGPGVEIDEDGREFKGFSGSVD